MITDEKIAEEAKKRYPHNYDDNENRMHKLASKRRRFIEGAKWARYELLDNGNLENLIEVVEFLLKEKDDGRDMNIHSDALEEALNKIKP